jgi:hypothetical protein
VRTWFVRIVMTLLAGLLLAELTYHVALRNWCLTWGTTPAEASASLPGDDLIPVFTGEATHAITINAPPQEVWLWIMQIGQDRSGFYSYTFLENLIGCDMPKVEHLVPAWSPRGVGETVWFGTPKRFGGQGRMIAAIVLPQQSFVMVMVNDWKRLQRGWRAQEVVWSFTVEPIGTQPTLTSRAAGRLFWEPMHFIMEQKMLRTIRDLAEHNHAVRGYRERGQSCRASSADLVRADRPEMPNKWTCQDEAHKDWHVQPVAAPHKQVMPSNYTHAGLMLRRECSDSFALELREM